MIHHDFIWLLYSQRSELLVILIGGEEGLLPNIRAKWSKIWNFICAPRLTWRAPDPLQGAETRTLAT
jgi:hypothetical protein